MNLSDEIIKKEIHPNQLFIDISLSSSKKNSIIEIISSYVTHFQDKLEREKLFSIAYTLYGRSFINLENLVVIMSELDKEFYFESTVSNEIQRIDIQYNLIKNSYVKQSFSELEAEIIKFFHDFESDVELTILK